MPQPKCPQCNSETKLVRTPLSRICTNNSCQFEAAPGEMCNHLDKQGDPDVILAGTSFRECWWECNQCGQRLDEDIYKLDNPSQEWLEADADYADQVRSWQS